MSTHGGGDAIHRRTGSGVWEWWSSVTTAAGTMRRANKVGRISAWPTNTRALRGVLLVITCITSQDDDWSHGLPASPPVCRGAFCAPRAADTRPRGLSRAHHPLLWG